jgi:sn-glycerol 3-phosphate transport system substrate-binding protein
MNPKMSVDMRALCSGLLIVLAALAGCAESSPPSTPASVNSPTPATPVATPGALTPSPIPTSIGPTTSSIALTIWGPEQFAPGEANAGASVLQAQYQAFMHDNPSITIDYVRKADYGEAGVQHFLVAANYAAPATLPDIAIVDAFELEPLVQAGLPQPLQELIAHEVTADLFPFAQQACSFDGDLVALQFEADIEHLAYYTKGPGVPPATWADLFEDSVTYIFPAAGDGGLVNDSFLIQYMAQGGELVDAEGKPALDESAIRQVLRLYKAGLDYNIISPKVLDIADLEECWEAYIEGNITMAHITSWRYLTSRARLQDTTFAPLPTGDGEPATMSRGWAFVIVTADPQRQAAAARFIKWLMSPQNLAEWSLATNHLPTLRSALPLVAWPRSYTDFLETQLESAFFRPSTPEFARIAQALQRAVQDVLTGERSPREATSAAMSALGLE